MSGLKIRESKCDYRFRLKTLLFKKEQHMLYFFAKVPIVEYKIKGNRFNFWKEFNRLTDSVNSGVMHEMSVLTAWGCNRFQDHERYLRTVFD